MRKIIKSLDVIYVGVVIGGLSGLQYHPFQNWEFWVIIFPLIVFYFVVKEIQNYYIRNS